MKSYRPSQKILNKETHSLLSSETRAISVWRIVSLTPLSIICNSHQAYTSVSSSRSLLKVTSCWKPAMIIVFYWKQGAALSPSLSRPLSCFIILRELITPRKKECLQNLDVNLLYLLIRIQAPWKLGYLCVRTYNGSWHLVDKQSINVAQWMPCLGVEEYKLLKVGAGRRNKKRGPERGSLFNLFFLLPLKTHCCR